MSLQHPEVGRFAEHLGTVGQAVDDWLGSDMPDALSSAVDWQTTLSGPPPQHGIGADATIQEYVRLLVAHGQRLTSPRSWGWITCGPTTVPTVVAAGAMAVAPQRQTLSAYHQVEELSLEWLGAICGLAPHMRGVYSSGGSTANLVALGAARQWAFEQRGWVRVQATTLPEHAASQRVLLKCGFEVEGRLRNFRIVRGEPRDYLLYARVPDKAATQ